MESKKVVLFGDRVQDRLAVEQENTTANTTWQRWARSEVTVQPGGVDLLTLYVRGEVDANTKVLSYGNAVPHVSMTHVVRSYASSTGSNDKVLRKSGTLGFRRTGQPEPDHVPMALLDQAKSAHVVVVEDANNEFRSSANALLDNLSKLGAVTWVLHKMTVPLAEGRVFEALNGLGNRYVLLIRHDALLDANVLTGPTTPPLLHDIVVGVQRRLGQEPYDRCEHVIVGLGLEGSLYRWLGPNGTEWSLVFDRWRKPGEYEREHPGGMPGTNMAFAGGVTAALLDVRSGKIPPHVMERGLRLARAVHLQGFGVVGAAPAYRPPLGTDQTTTDGLTTVDPLTIGEGDGWLFSALIEAEERLVAQEIVRNGPDRILANVPTKRYGALLAIDAEEIRAFEAISNLIGQYLIRPDAKRPLSIAVFGSPGSGKSFTVKQLAKAQRPGPEPKMEELEFNVSQMHTPEDLAMAFQQIRNVVIRGKVPLAFFDEFDSDMNNTPLGWLKTFLAPMQDGKFMDRGTEFQIGRAVLIFAGGTVSCFANIEKKMKDHANAKLPDFLSRLRGHLDISGTDAGRYQLIRRAMTLRFLIRERAPALDGANIASDVLDQLLDYKYIHGARSMEAVLDMCQLSGTNTFTKDLFPDAKQLAMHVKVDETP